jgi:hypothetical protein
MVRSLISHSGFAKNRPAMISAPPEANGSSTVPRTPSLRAASAAPSTVAAPNQVASRVPQAR